MRAGLAIGEIEAGAEADVDVLDSTGAEVSAGFSTPYGLGDIGNRGLVIWGVAAAWLFLVWRAVKGY